MGGTSYTALGHSGLAQPHPLVGRGKQSNFALHRVGERKMSRGHLSEPFQKRGAQGFLDTMTMPLQGPRSNGASQSWSGVHPEGTYPFAGLVRL